MNTPNPTATAAPAPVASDQAIMSAIPWYRSPVVISQVSATVSALVSIAPKNDLVIALGLNNPDEVSRLITGIAGVVAAIASVVGVALRVGSKVQPVTMTQVGAEMHPNSLAVQQAQKTPPKT